MASETKNLEKDILTELGNTSSLDEIEAVRIKYLGKKGLLTAEMKALGHLESEARREAGQALNAVKDTVIKALDDRRDALARETLDKRLATEQVDISLSHRPQAAGSIHPLAQTLEEVIAIFAEMGFTIAEGPDIESDYYNFTALNMPEDHPARQEHDTFYLPPDQAGERKVLRTHTSPVQIRTMENAKPPIRIMALGRTYRSDHDATHSPMFHQCEGLVIDDGITMAHLKGCLIEFCRAFFDVDDLPVRFRPSYFPFTEPSAEVDIGCRRDSEGLKIGAGDDWLEILGCGMVNPRVLEYCGLDPNEHQGFAFGVGLERIAMLKYGIPDLRPFYDGDLRWLKHYGFPPSTPPSVHLGLGA